VGLRLRPWDSHRVVVALGGPQPLDSPHHSTSSIHRGRRRMLMLVPAALATCWGKHKQSSDRYREVESSLRKTLQ